MPGGGAYKRIFGLQRNFAIETLKSQFAHQNMIRIVIQV
jgi:hypothetical protein